MILLRGTGDEPRRGCWAIDPACDAIADGRMLTQEQTDLLIGYELWSYFGWSTDKEQEDLCSLGERTSWSRLSELLGSDYPRWGVFSQRHRKLFPVQLGYGEDGTTTPTRQRGGIHSDPRVRELARQAWGDRDLAYKIPHNAKPSVPPEPVDLRDGTAVRFSLLELD